MEKNYIGIRWSTQSQNIVEYVISNGIKNIVQDYGSGVVYYEETPNGNKIISSNDWENSSILPNIIKKTIHEKSTSINGSVSILELSNDCYNKVYDKLSVLGNVVNLQIVIRSLMQKTNFYYNSEFDISNIFDILSGEIVVNINIFGEDNLIKRELCFSKKDGIGEQIINEVNSIVYEYQDKIELENVVIKNGLYDIILPSGRGGILIHETIGHSLESDHFFDNNNCLKGMFGKKIFDSNISISDTCCNNNMLSYKYSSDGSRVKSVEMVKNGFINGLLTDKYSSQKWSIPDTGNGRASSYEHSVIPRMRNTYLHNGCCNKKSIFSNTRNGIYALEIGGGRTNIQTGDFVFNISKGCLIKNGEFVGITNPFLFTGKIIDTLNKIDMIADDLTFQFGYCGKQDQLIPVSYGQPTIRISDYCFGD